MDNLSLYYDMLVKRGDKIIKKYPKRECRSFVKQFLQFMFNHHSFQSGLIMKDYHGVLIGVGWDPDSWHINGGVNVYQVGPVVGAGYNYYPVVSPSDMTSNILPAPYIASASGTGYGVAFRVFDGVSNSYWGHNVIPAWVKLDVGSGQAFIVTDYDVTVPTSYGLAYFPKNWTLEGSNDDFVSDINILDTVVNQTTWVTLETRNFTCDVATTAYRYFRLNVSAVNGGTGVVVDALTLRAALDLTPVTVSINDYQLAGLFTHGTTNTSSVKQIQYSATTFGAVSTDPVGSRAVVARVFTNGSGSDITIGEIGIHSYGYIGGLGSAYFLVVRDLLSVPITLANGETLTLNYTFQTTI
jgi:hypothetical protein